jgi:hypothetical protein
MIPCRGKEPRALHLDQEKVGHWVYRVPLIDCAELPSKHFQWMRNSPHHRIRPKAETRPVKTNGRDFSGKLQAE